MRVFGSPPGTFAQRQNILRARVQLHVDLEADHGLPALGDARALRAHEALPASRGGTGSNAKARLERMPGGEQRVLGEGGADQLQPDGQALR